MSLGLRLDEVDELLVLKGGNYPCLCSSTQLFIAIQRETMF